MTAASHWIGHDQTVAEAHRVMREHRVRHLPVLESGKLAGVVSERDLFFLEALKDVDPETVMVTEAMSQDTYVVGPRSSMRGVAAQMTEHRYGSVVVIDQDRVVGIFTTLDALGAMSTLLEEQRGRT
ncbi:MAG: CBS domain-containing protein [Polyangiaceae bacterium]